MGRMTLVIFLLVSLSGIEGFTGKENVGGACGCYLFTLALTNYPCNTGYLSVLQEYISAYQGWASEEYVRSSSAASAVWDAWE